jgi:hypothetical protein
MKALLFVTWFYYGSPPASYQTPFDSIDACEVARAGILGDAERMKDDANKEIERKRALGIIYNPIVPTVSAVCSVQ